MGPTSTFRTSSRQTGTAGGWPGDPRSPDSEVGLGVRASGHIHVPGHLGQLIVIQRQGILDLGEGLAGFDKMGAGREPFARV